MTLVMLVASACCIALAIYQLIESTREKRKVWKILREVDYYILGLAGIDLGIFALMEVFA